MRCHLSWIWLQAVEVFSFIFISFFFFIAPAFACDSRVHSTVVCSVRDYGADDSGMVDSSAAFNKAFTEQDSVYIPRGIYKISIPIIIPAGRNFSIYGDGADSVINAEKGAFIREDERSINDHLVIKDVAIYGGLKKDPKQARSRSLVVLRWGKSLEISNVTFSDSQFFGIRVAAYSRVSFLNVKINRTARDGINVSGSRNISIIGGAIEHVGDDAVAAHFEGSDNEIAPYDRNLLIDGVHIVDAFGIKVLGARSVKIVNNTLQWVKGYGVFVGADRQSGEGYIPQHDVIISGNLISDIVQPKLFGYPNLDNSALVLYSYLEPNLNDKMKIPTASATEFRKVPDGCTNISSGFQIFGNIFKKTSLGVFGAKFKDYSGFEAFVDVGYDNNPVMPSDYGVSDGNGIVFGGCWEDVNISGNFFRGFLLSIAKTPYSSINMRAVRVDNNNFTQDHFPFIELSGGVEGYMLLRGNIFRSSLSGSYEIYKIDPGFRILGADNFVEGCLYMKPAAVGFFEGYCSFSR